MAFSPRNLWRRILRRVVSFRRVPQRRKGTDTRLFLEILEDRNLLSTVNWIGGSGDWDTAANWLDATTLTNHVPGPSDNAVINVPGVTVTAASNVTDSVQSISNQDSLILSAGSLLCGTFNNAGSLSVQDNIDFGIHGGGTSSGTITGTALSCAWVLTAVTSLRQLRRSPRRVKSVLAMRPSLGLTMSAGPRRSMGTPMSAAL